MFKLVLEILIVITMSPNFFYFSLKGNTHYSGTNKTLRHNYKTIPVLNYNLKSTGS